MLQAVTLKTKKKTGDEYPSKLLQPAKRHVKVRQGNKKLNQHLANVLILSEIFPNKKKQNEKHMNEVDFYMIFSARCALLYGITYLCVCRICAYMFLSTYMCT